jgi:hypothetical protein
MSYATPKSERYSLSEGAIDKLAAKAKENPDLSRGEFGKGELVSALDDLTDRELSPVLGPGAHDGCPDHT